MSQIKSLGRISSISSVPKVIETLRSLDRQLAQAGLENVRIFNRTYLVISENVHAQNGIFKDGKTLGKLDIHFAQTYFKVLDNYLEDRQNSPAWKIFFDFCSDNRSSAITYLWLGANAHINNDLPFSLEKAVTGAFFQDYKNVQTVIDQSIKEILPSITKNIIKQKVYFLMIKFISRRWRKEAWNNSKSAGSIIQNKAGSYARRIVLISKIIDLVRI